MEEIKCEQVGMLSGDGWDKCHETNRRVYSSNGLSPTITTMGGGQREPKIIEPVIVDEIYNNREPRVYREHCPTIRAERQGLEVVEPICLNSKVDGKQPSLTDRVYDTDGISTCVTTSPFFMGNIAEPTAYDDQNGYLRQDGCVGTLTTDGSSPKHNNRIAEPRICAMRGRNPDNPSDRTAGSPTEQRIEIGSEETSNTLTTVQKDNLVVEPQLVGGIGEHDFGKQNRQGDRVYSSEAIACALTAQPLGNAGGYSYLYQEPSYRIRKLTPDECFRLQGVKQEDFERVAKNQSMSALYHEAGDSIAITCLMAILGVLFGVDYQTKINELVEELKQ